MPPVNRPRRALLAAAAMAVLAQQGSRGLTHRAVDVAAGVPPGTTSRYFRSREALLGAVVDHAISQHLDDMERVSAIVGPISTTALADLLAGAARVGMSSDRLLHIAVAELHLEATRHPGVRAALAEATTKNADSIRAVFAAAGVALDDEELLRFVSFMNGLLYVGMTVPDGTSPIDMAERLVRAEVADVLARQRRG